MLLLAPAIQAADLTGRARVVDGDTLEISGQRIRIEGIDAFEKAQTCLDAKGREWSCGMAGRDLLSQLAAGIKVRCTGKAYDDYGRLLADCYAGDLNLGQTMVDKGLAVAFIKYTDTYAARERLARNNGIGVWSGSFLPPAEFRARQWAATTGTAQGDCPIKGNISDSGRIYHMPYSENYADTQINTARGERWFCSEADALAAGWRAPRN